MSPVRPSGGTISSVGVLHDDGPTNTTDEEDDMMRPRGFTCSETMAMGKDTQVSLHKQLPYRSQYVNRLLCISDGQILPYMSIYDVWQ